jgi:UDP-2-acetamido-2-deoxy-ribo-hexuluronate aminotransferase
VPFQPAYASLGHRRGQFPVAEALMSQCVSLPLYPELTDDQVDYVAGTLRELLVGGAVRVGHEVLGVSHG